MRKNSWFLSSIGRFCGNAEAGSGYSSILYQSRRIHQGEDVHRDGQRDHPRLYFSGTVCQYSPELKLLQFIRRKKKNCSFNRQKISPPRKHLPYVFILEQPDWTSSFPKVLIFIVMSLLFHFTCLRSLQESPCLSTVSSFCFVCLFPLKNAGLFLHMQNR